MREVGDYILFCTSLCEFDATVIQIWGRFWATDSR